MNASANSIFFIEKIYSAIVHYFIHFYFITVFEIIFYKYYIFEYEKNIIHHLIESTVNEYVPNVNVHIYNPDVFMNFMKFMNFNFTNTTTIKTFTENGDSFVGNSKHEIDIHNNHLFYIHH